ncbi:MAG TPA: pitrilysin family protein [bacterium]|nr:pitrilysin family protein [bacterium]
MIDIPFEKHILDNGLTVILHEDHKAPVVAVNVWYHVGSKNEKPGKTGFAHLFEHLMFNGSEHMDVDYFQVMENIGATNLNGTTNEDRTNYFQNVPVSALDIALWMESDRMGHMVGAITQAKLDEQRGVVQNEKRQGENEPYAVEEELIVQATWPVGHPYSWTVIGSMEDLDHASLEDVHAWFRNYYGAANAVLVIAGAIDPKDALTRAKKYFGEIPSGPPVSRYKSWIARRSGRQRAETHDRVPLAKITKVWNIPEWGTTEAHHLDLISDILGSGKNSRLYKRLVYDEMLATDVNAYVDLREIAGQFTITAKARPGIDIAQLEKAIDEELVKLCTEGPSEKELTRVRTQFFAGFVRGIERIGGFGGKSDILARGEIFSSNPQAYKKNMHDVESATTEKLRDTARHWLSDGDYTLTTKPFPEFQITDAAADRNRLPEAGVPPEVRFSKMERHTLANGLKIILVPRHSVPVINMSLVLDAGYASDALSIPGTASLAMAMLDEGTTGRSSLEISESLAMLGSTLTTGSSLDVSTVNLSTLKNNLSPSLDIFADVICRPIFPEQDFLRLREQQRAGIRQEKSSPVPMALRVLPQLLYGPSHAYGIPFTGSGTESALDRITRDDLKRFHQTWFHPNHTTLIVVGDTTADVIIPLIENKLGAWQSGTTPQKNVVPVKIPDAPVVYLMDRPGSQQSTIFAAHIAPPTNNPDEIAIQTMNNILGGDFTSRINMNLREDKHWAYGAFSFLWDARGQRPFIAYAPVQSDKTKESVAEIRKEISDFITIKPLSEEEFMRTQSNQVLQLPGTWETNNAVLGSLQQLVQFGFNDDYFDHYAQSIRNLSPADVRKAAQSLLKPDHLIWVIVGDRKQIENEIRSLNIGVIRYIDSDGNVLES